MAKKDKYDVGSIPMGLPNIVVWKAFVLFDTEKTDKLQVDVSGDDFSFSPEDAIRHAYQSLGDRLMELVGKGIVPMFVSGDRVEVPDEEKSFKESKIILLAERFNDAREFKNTLLGGKPGQDLSFVLAMKRIPGMVENGMEVHMAEYDVRNISVESKTAKLGPDSVALTHFTAEFSGERDPESIFPEKVDFKYPFGKKDDPSQSTCEFVASLPLDILSGGTLESCDPKPELPKMKLDRTISETPAELESCDPKPELPKVELDRTITGTPAELESCDPKPDLAPAEA